MDVAFTRHMEEQLDKIEDQHLEWVSVLKEFYTPFCDSLENAKKEMVHAKAETQPSEYTCPKCGEPMVIRSGRRGRFLACSGFPKCRNTRPLPEEEKRLAELADGQVCDVCGKPMAARRGRYGLFLGCTGYPDCKGIKRLPKEAAE